MGEYGRDAVVVVSVAVSLCIVLQFLFRICNCGRMSVVFNRSFCSAVIITGIVSFLGYAVTRLRHCTASWKVAGSITDGVFGLFHCHNLSGRTMAPGLSL